MFVNDKVIRNSFSEQGLPKFDDDVHLGGADSNYEAVEVHVEKRVCKRLLIDSKKYVLEFSELQLKEDNDNEKHLASATLNLETKESFNWNSFNSLESTDIESRFSELGCDIEHFNSGGGRNILQGGYPTFVTWFAYNRDAPRRNFLGGCDSEQPWRVLYWKTAQWS